MKFFSTDGIRGHEKELISNDIVFNLGSIIGSKSKRILLGQDTRKSSSLISDLLINGLISQGCNVDFIGVCPTPMISFLLKNNDYDYGFMITASHNPYFDNGIKVFSRNGEKISKKECEEIVEELESKKHFSFNIKLGNLKYVNDDSYIDFINYQIDFKNRFKIVIDVSNGSNFEIINKLKIDNIKVINNEPNGVNINDNVGSLFPENLQNYLKENDYDYGFCFDGDGDRLILVSKEKIYNGDDLIYLLSKSLNLNKVVVTTSSNRGLINALEKINIETLISSVGDINVLTMMKENNVLLGGEVSGHLIFLDYQASDSLYSLIKVLRVLNSHNIECFDKYYEINKNINLDNENPLNIENIKKELNELVDKEDYLLIRESGTEEVVRINIQTRKNDNYQMYNNYFIKMEIR